MKEKLKNPFVQQYALELLLPIAGYFLFDWSLTIIAVFYFLDQIASDLVYTRKINKIGKENGVKNHLFISLVALFIFLIIFTIEIVVFNDLWPLIIQQDTTTFHQEIWNFTVGELWLLFPLLIAVYHMKDLFTFYMPRRFLNYDFRKTILSRTLMNMGIFILVFIGLQITPSLKGIEIPALFIFIGIKLAYDFSIGRWSNKYGIKKSA